MNRWLSTFGALLLSTGMVGMGVLALVGETLPIWAFALWLAGCASVAIPASAAITRRKTRALISVLESQYPGAVASAVSLTMAEWGRLLEPAMRLGDKAPIDRVLVSNSYGKSLDNSALLMADEALQVWAGPPRLPQRLIEIPWSDVRLDSSRGGLTIVRPGSEPVTVAFAGDSPRSSLTKAQLDRRLSAVAGRLTAE
ncbi:hypothetical protein [Agromyces sp. Root81]|uniref:hypothetical protein n=1 Tax=Agromyces sp. Root81 TaxID=1736601 RepID=UPI0012F7DECD|nr:hypothetical protein [Agromyces sp. Root81]